MFALRCTEVYGLLVSGKSSRISVIQTIKLTLKSIEVFARVVVFTGRSLQFGPNDLAML